MVDWKEVERLRSKGWEWSRIASDPKVGFQADSAAGEPGRALRALYYRRGREKAAEAPSEPGSKRSQESLRESRWSIARIGLLLTPLFAIWFLLAFFIPSPVGLLLPAIPWLALGLGASAVLLLFGMYHRRPNFKGVLRTTVVGGVVLGLLISGGIGIGAVSIFGCPLLPSTLGTQPGPGWGYANTGAWQQNGQPVVYFYGATWCPFCSASSWAIWKALSMFGTVQGAAQGWSSTSDVYPGTPEVILAGISMSKSPVAFIASEDTSGIDGQPPTTSNCVQQAYVTAYSGGSIPFLVIDGRYVHGGSTIVNPASLSQYSYVNSGTTGWSQVQSQVINENGTAWNAISGQAWWIMAYLAKSTGLPVSQLATTYHWSSATKNAVSYDLAQI